METETITWEMINTTYDPVVFYKGVYPSGISTEEQEKKEKPQATYPLSMIISLPGPDENQEGVNMMIMKHKERDEYIAVFIT